ncbi:MAG: exo-beta-N-acetylmuramidase NamZ domain-containing protein [Nitrospirota bacterium]
MLQEEKFEPVTEIIEKAVYEGKITGAVIMIGNQGKVPYHRAFGYRTIKPKKIPMSIDTIFDIASLTKVVATTTAVMQLFEKGKLRLDVPVAEYWPEFKANGKEQITIRQLLTHYSGLRPGLSLTPEWDGYDIALKKIIEEKPVYTPGTRFVYSDINFKILGEIVRRISGQPLNTYCEENIFKPLGMSNTCFNPSPTLRERITPIQGENGIKGGAGEVHDPSCSRMGGVAGHAGLFSTTGDLSIFIEMLLAGGTYNGKYILSPLTIEKMTTPQSPPNKMVLRGLGWDIDSPFSSSRGGLFPVGSYGHTGYTGSSVWIDPATKTYVILLLNRIYPGNNGDIPNLRSQISTVVSAAIRNFSPEHITNSRRSLTGYHELMKSYGIKIPRNGRVKTGIDVLKTEKFAPLKGLRIGLITNHSGINSSGERDIDLLYKAPKVKLVAIFTPEHGLSGNEETHVSSGTEPVTGLPVYSLYNNVKQPTTEMLKGIDALVFDIQDVGARFFTYITTMGYAMEAAAKKGIAFYVLDRPNPITASIVEGHVIDEDLKSFTGYFPIPIRHGMTIGELAQMFNTENKIGAKLHIIKMQDYQRTDWFDETGLLWVNPSPNLRTLTEVILYPGVAMVEGANVSVGRGTDTPFELLGAPWINAKELASYLNEREIQGVRFMPVDFIPRSSQFENQLCHGVQIILLDREALDTSALGIEIISAIYNLYPEEFEIDKTLDLIASRKVMENIKAGKDPHSIIMGWQESLERFREIWSKYLLY